MPKDPAYEKRAQAFIAEVLWFAEAIATQKAKEQPLSNAPTNKPKQ